MRIILLSFIRAMLFLTLIGLLLFIGFILLVTS